jgi:phosphinothricin acetyltransferase
VGYGVGKKLLSQLIEGCQRVGCHRMIACICGENPVSVGLHGSLGFEPLGSIPEAGWKFEQWVDMSMMQRAL